MAPGRLAELRADPRYAALPPGAVPATESLGDTAARLLPYWHDELIPALRDGTSVLVVGHGNWLRAFLAHLDTLTQDEVDRLRVPPGTALCYHFDDRLRPRRRGGEYLRRTGS